MNKHLYRVIFSKAKGMFVVVGELAKHKTKSSDAGNIGTGGRPSTRPLVAILRPLSFMVMASLGAIIMVPSVEGQIVADPNAPRTEQATVLVTANDVPQVDIQTPTAAGVSRNVFSQYDVDGRGVIVNNSRVNTQTQLAGWVKGNPWLANGTARVIVNEVNSSNPSMLGGYVELAGDRAQFVFANPAGITCSGCGFINAQQATLTTGKPIFSGGALTGYQVQNGTVRVDGLGMDATTTDFTNIIARSVEVNAGIWANDLRITAGTNRVDVDNENVVETRSGGGAPAFAIDVSALGGMYAGKITLVGTEDGVGMRNLGEIGAAAGDVIITLDGKLENANRIASSENITINTENGVENTGVMYAGNDMEVTTRGDILNEGVMASFGDTLLTAEDENGKIISSKGSYLGAGIDGSGQLVGDDNTLNVSAPGEVEIHGTMLSSGSINIESRAVDVSDSIQRAQDITITASASDINASGANIDASDKLELSTPTVLRTDGASIAAGRLSIDADSLSNIAGEIIQTGSASLTIEVNGDIDNTSGRIASNGVDLTLIATTLTNTTGRLEHGGSGEMSINAETFLGEGGTIATSGDLLLDSADLVLDHSTIEADNFIIEADSLSNQSGRLLQRGDEDFVIEVAGVIDNTDGEILSNAGLIIVATELLSDGGVLEASGELDFDIEGDIDNTGGRIVGLESISIDGEDIDSESGQISALGSLTITASGMLTNADGQVVAQGDIDLDSTDDTNNQSGLIGSIAGSVDVLVTNGELENTAGRIEANQNLTIDSNGVDNSDGVILGGQVSVDTGGANLRKRFGSF